MLEWGGLKSRENCVADSDKCQLATEMVTNYYSQHNANVCILSQMYHALNRNAHNNSTVKPYSKQPKYTEIIIFKPDERFVIRR